MVKADVSREGKEIKSVLWASLIPGRNIFQLKLLSTIASACAFGFPQIMKSMSNLISPMMCELRLSLVYTVVIFPINFFTDIRLSSYYVFYSASSFRSDCSALYLPGEGWMVQNGLCSTFQNFSGCFSIRTPSFLSVTILKSLGFTPFFCQMVQGTEKTQF